VTRGKTRPGRLRLLDPYVAAQHGGVCGRYFGDEVAVDAVDVGIGARPDTTIALHRALRSVDPAVRTYGLDVDAERVAALDAAGEEGVEGVVGGFEARFDAPIGTVRAANVLRQYALDRVSPALAAMGRWLEPGGLLVEGSTDKTGGRGVFRELGRLDGGLQPNALIFVFDVHGSGGFAPRALTPYLPRGMGWHGHPGPAVAPLLAAWTAAFEEARAAGATGARDLPAPGGQGSDPSERRAGLDGRSARRQRDHRPPLVRARGRARLGAAALAAAVRALPGSPRCCRTNNAGSHGAGSSGAHTPSPVWQMPFTHTCPSLQTSSSVHEMSRQPWCRSWIGSSTDAGAGLHIWCVGQAKPSSHEVATHALAAQVKPSPQLVSSHAGPHSLPTPSRLHPSGTAWHTASPQSSELAHSSIGGIPHTCHSLGPAQISSPVQSAWASQARVGGSTMRGGSQRANASGTTHAASVVGCM
jgi:hypothetical protein